MASRRRNRLNWKWNPELEEFTTPTGKISLLELAQLRYGILACSDFDLHGPWKGWRIRGGRLYPPYQKRGGQCFSPQSLRGMLLAKEGVEQGS